MAEHSMWVSEWIYRSAGVSKQGLGWRLGLRRDRELSLECCKILYRPRDRKIRRSSLKQNLRDR
jgi:hypothetical protein